MRVKTAHRCRLPSVSRLVCLAPICLFALVAMFGPVVTASVTLPALRKRGATYGWVLLALLVSVVADAARIPLSADARDVLVFFYPGIQLGLFAAAIGGMGPALLVAGVTLGLASGDIFVNGVGEPGIISRTAGSFLVGYLALSWDHPLRTMVMVYCVGGAVAWLLWVPHMDVYSTANTVSYVTYQMTRLVAMGLFIHAAYKWREA